MVLRGFTKLPQAERCRPLPRAARMGGRPVEEAPIVIDWGGLLWIAGQRVALAVAELNLPQVIIPDRRPRRVISHAHVRWVDIGARRSLSCSGQCTLPKPPG